MAGIVKMVLCSTVHAQRVPLGVLAALGRHRRLQPPMHSGCRSRWSWPLSNNVSVGTRPANKRNTLPSCSNDMWSWLHWRSSDDMRNWLPTSSDAKRT